MTEKSKFKPAKKSKIQIIRLGVQLLCLALTLIGFWSNVQATSIIILIATILGGAYYCGWICPFGTLQDIISKLGKKLGIKKRKVPKSLHKYLKFTRYILFALFTFFSLDFIFILLSYDPRSNLDLLLSGRMIGITAIVVLIMLALLNLFYERIFCSYLCVHGARFGLFSSLRIFRIKRNSDTCINCKKCDKTCPMNIEVSTSEQLTSIQCINCFQCTSACPVEDTLTYGHITFIKPIKGLFLLVISLIVLFFITNNLYYASTGEQLLPIDLPVVLTYDSSENGEESTTDEVVADNMELDTSHEVLVNDSETNDTDEVKVDEAEPIVTDESKVDESEPIVTNESKVDESDPIVTDDANIDESEPLITDDTNIDESEPLVTDDAITEEPEPLVTEEVITEEPEPLVTEEVIVEEPEPLVTEEVIIEEPEPLVTEEVIVEEPEPVVTEEVIIEEPEPIVTEEVIVEEIEPEIYGAAAGIPDGVYSSEGDGYNGSMIIEVTVVNQTITEIDVIDYSDDYNWFVRAYNGIVPNILEKQSVDVDTVSRATYSSKGIIEAVTKALNSAKN